MVRPAPIMLERPETLSDTIVACATPPGEGAIAVVRLSGPRAREIAQRLAPSPKPRRSHHLSVATIRNGGGEILDRAMIVEMHAPRSYTGDDVVELHLHGARTVVQTVTQVCLALGARTARPGEYSLRAYLNGRMSLDEAEAVADLVAARSDGQRRVALAHLRGRLTSKISNIVREMESVLAEWRAGLDFPEHLHETGFLGKHVKQLDAVSREVDTLVATARVDLRHARMVVLCGAPNVGKSTLLNRWAGEERVLVDPTPGTTRDPVEIDLVHGPVRLAVWDTAGVRDDACGLEARGIEHSEARMGEADLAVWLMQPGNWVWPPKLSQILVVGNKADLASSQERERLEAEATTRGLDFVGWVSAKTGEGCDDLRQLVAGHDRGGIREGDAIVVRERHSEALREAQAALIRLRECRSQKMTLDVELMELEEAARALGRILGRDVDLEVLDQIFSEFCIGK